MKVNPELQSKMDTAAKTQRTPAESRSSFQGMVQSQTHQLKQQEVQQLMNNIAAQGDKLARFRSLRDLFKFKRLVKQFLQDTVYDGIALEQSHDFSMNGRNQQLTIVKEVDEKLVELTEDMMNRERKTVDLLKLIGEIKGLLINLYT